MKNIAKYLALAVLMLSAAAAGAAGFEALKSNSWLPDLAQIGAQPGPGMFSPGHPVPPPPHRGEMRNYGRGGYTFESGARSAAQEAEQNLRAAGVTVIATRVYKEASYPWHHGFTVEYLSGSWGLGLQTYASGTFSFESEARNEMERTKQNLRASGFLVVVGQTIKQANYPWNYTYEIDYLRRGHQGGGRVTVYRSSEFRHFAEAQLKMNLKVRELEMRGERVESAEVIRSGRGYIYEIRVRQGRR